MRRLGPRPRLPRATARRLRQEAARVAASQDQVAEADRRYENARRAAWFRPVIRLLDEMSGPGSRCMFCSGSESSQIEHFKPKAHYPLDAMEWENFLWVCAICNSIKLARFPIEDPLINPVAENVWDFCFLDEYGNFSALWRAEIDNVDPRGETTIEILGLDRDALQESRQIRLLSPA